LNPDVPFYPADKEVYLNNIAITAVNREPKGKGGARKLRRGGQLPAVLYGAKTDEPVTLAINTGDFMLKMGEMGQSLIDLTLEDDATVTKTVMLKEVQTDPVSRKPLHVDFYEVDMKQTITVDVPVVTVGKALGEEEGGMIQMIRRELAVTCLPANIPESIEVDVTGLTMGDSLHLSEVKLPEGVEVLSEADFTVLTIVSSKMAEIEIEEEVEEEPEEGVEAAEGEAAEGEADEAPESE